jgi:cytochrome c553
MKNLYQAIFTIALLGAATSVLAQPFNGNPEAGKEKAGQCAACHGMDGNGILAQYPNLGGQHADYLYRSLVAYKNGERNNAIMAGQVANLNDEDLRDLAAYYAMQEGLYVPKKP